MIKLWVRIGAEVTLTEEEFESVKSGNSSIDGIVECKIRNGEYVLDGETYSPDIDDDRYINGQMGVELLL